MYKLFVSLRYLRTSRVTVLPVVCVTLGVVALLLVSSVMGGFARDMRARIRGTTSHIGVTSGMGARYPFADWEKVADVVRGVRGVVAVAPHLEWPVLIPPTMKEAQLIGIDPSLEPQVGEWKEYLLDGKSPDFMNDGVHPAPPGAIFGCDMIGNYQSRDYAIVIDRSEEIGDAAQLQHVLYLTHEVLKLLNQGDRFNIIACGGGLQELSPDKPLERGERAMKLADDFLAQLVPGGTQDLLKGMRRAFEYRPEGDRLFKMVVISTGTGSARVETILGGPQGREFWAGQGVSVVPFDARTTSDPRDRLIGHYRGSVQHVITGRIAAGAFVAARCSFTIVGAFKSGMAEYDENYIYVPLAEVQRLIGAAGRINRLCVAVKDPERAAEVRKAIQQALEASGLGAFIVRTWEDERASILRAVAVERGVTNVLLACVMVVAGVCILAILLMLVREKTRDIGILRSLGATVPGITALFLLEGLLIGVTGTFLGCVIGFDFADHLNDAADYVYSVSGLSPFPKDLYMLDKIPTVPVYTDAIWIGGFAILVSVLAAVYPAVKAALFHPVEALRYE